MNLIYKKIKELLDQPLQLFDILSSQTAIPRTVATQDPQKIH